MITIVTGEVLGSDDKELARLEVFAGEVEAEEEVEAVDAEEFRWAEDRFRPCSRTMPLKDSRCFWCKEAVVRQDVGESDGEGSFDREIEVEGEDGVRVEKEEGRMSSSPSAKAVGMEGVRMGRDRSYSLYALWESRLALRRSASAAEGDAGESVAMFVVERVNSK